MILQRREQGVFTESSVGGCCSNAKWQQTESKNRTMATTETKAARRATTMRETRMTGRKSAVPSW